MTRTASQLVLDMVRRFDALAIPYALGGSMASALIGEPRSTVVVDFAARLDRESFDALIEDVAAEFYVPVASAHAAVESHDSFNLVDSVSGLKVDVFVVGDGLLDRRQLANRVRVAFPGSDDGIWMTSPADQILRKLTWLRDSDSGRQWRDVVGIIASVGDMVDTDDLRRAAAEIGVSELLEQALAEAADE